MTHLGPVLALFDLQRERSHIGQLVLAGALRLARRYRQLRRGRQRFREPVHADLGSENSGGSHPNHFVLSTSSGVDGDRPLTCTLAYT